MARKGDAAPSTLSSVEDPLDRPQDLIQRTELAQHRVGADLLGRGVRPIAGCGTRNRDDSQALAHPAQLADDLAAIDAGHAHIRDDEVRLLAAEALQPVLPVHRLDDPVAAILEDLAEHTAVEPVIVDQEDERQAGASKAVRGMPVLLPGGV